MDISEFTARRQTLTASTGDIAYTESGAGPAAVFVHGLATSGALWRHVIEQVDGTTRYIAVDLSSRFATEPAACRLTGGQGNAPRLRGRGQGGRRGRVASGATPLLVWPGCTRWASTPRAGGNP